MTNQEAISILKTWRVTGDKEHEALDMAISALQAQADGDTISRQTAIDAIVDCTVYGNADDLKEAVMQENAWNKWSGGVLEALEAVEELPYAQTEPQWIPVSERLPVDDTDCLVSIRCQAKVVVVDMATYSTDLFKVDKEDFFGNRGESGWYCFNGEYGYCKVLNVIAWMPLPEPYAERRTDGRD